MANAFNMNGLTKKLDAAADCSRVVIRDAYDFFKKTTPKKSGNARRNTTLNGNTIKGDYSYAGKLDSGSSKQAPSGMTDPTLKEVEKLVDRYFKSIRR